MIPTALKQTLVDVSKLLRQNEIDFALIGGLAVTVRAEPRATMDVDLIINCDVQRCLTLVDELHGSEFQPLFEDVDDVVKRAFILPLKHQQTSVTVDLALGLTGFEQQAISTSSLIAFDEFEVPVVSAESLMLMKLLAGRPRDHEDIRKIVLKQQDNIDWNFIETTGQQLQDSFGEDLMPVINQLRNETKLSDE